MSQGNVALRDYQLEALEAVEKAEARGVRRQVLARCANTTRSPDLT
jgi:hypothetical protein